MRIVHIVSNFRWTERVEPAADLALGQQALGHDVCYLCGRNQGETPENIIQGRAARKGLVFDDHLELLKHTGIASALRDLPRLRNYLNEFQPDVIHCHLPNAHLLAALAIRSSDPKPILVRTLYEPAGPEWPCRYRWGCRPHTDGVIVLRESNQLRETGGFSSASGRVATIVPGIDIEEFTGHPEWGPLDAIQIPDDAFVVGMVTAIGKRRRLDLVFDALAQLAPRYPQLRLMICGRGKIGEFVHKPVRELGLGDRVILAGYCRNDDLVRAYRTMDALVYPRHGTDQSCRTVREALASGVPVVATDLGLIRKLIRNGETGFVTEFSGNGLASGLSKLLDMSPERRQRMREAAAADAKQRFCRVHQAEKVVAFYQQLQQLRASA